ncbi:hypothetical protein [Streptomyces sp. 11x1]|uniref:hypothetical protein n=1 Tax=Streptomyces sp. 11x1 TaxID=3038642 RepID=UPI0029301E0B|nr:hypothetical protein [Streptomyces sp. 11x1]WNZ10159.1 hypothetical protein P8T65_22915 [Streptomyces sp. 11x1]
MSFSGTYTNVSRREVSAATPGGHISMTEYDRFGNTVRELSAGNRKLALATSGAVLEWLTRLGIDAQSTADRARQMSSVAGPRWCQGRCRVCWNGWPRCHPRNPRGARRTLAVVLALAACAVLAGAISLLAWIRWRLRVCREPISTLFRFGRDLS